MDQIEFLAGRLQVSKQMKKKWEDREKEWRKELVQLLDEHVIDVAAEELFLSNEVIDLLSSDTEWPEAFIKRYFLNRFGNEYEMVQVEEVRGGYKIKFRVPKTAAPVSVAAGRFKVKRSSYTVKDSFDLDVLKMLLSDDEFEAVTSTEVRVYLDDDKVNDILAEQPELLDKFKLALKAGDLRQRLDIKAGDDE